MKIFLDTANLDEIREGAALGVVEAHVERFQIGVDICEDEVAHR